MPLDRSGRLAGTVGLRFAVQAGHPRRPLLVALAGGPGQSAVGLAGELHDDARPAAAPLPPGRRRPARDRASPGPCGARPCSACARSTPSGPAAVGACAQAVGPRRAAYTTADTVQDLDALRAAFGSAKLALMGVSYGTHVALQYARTFPARTDRLVLDSIVGPDGPDPFLLDTLRNLPRVLRTAVRRAASARASRPTRWPTWPRSCAGSRDGPDRGDRRRRAGPAAHRALPQRRGAAVPHDRRRPQPLPAGAARRRRSPPPGPAMTRCCCGCARSARAA